MEKNLNFAPLKCLEMLLNRPGLWQFSDLSTDNKKAYKNSWKYENENKFIPRTLFLCQMSEYLIYLIPPGKWDIL